MIAINLATKTCGDCLDSKIMAAFIFAKGDKKLVRERCNMCHYEKRRDRWRAEGNLRSLRISRDVAVRRSLDRRSGVRAERWILYDSRKGDKKTGRVNDLTKSFIAEMIAQGCSYCGEASLRMTLDRIDNAKGHTTDNVVPACIRCNYTRRDMPYAAWLLVAPGMRAARESGAFDGWTARIIRNRNPAR